MGGDIFLKSKYGEGTKLTVFLPLNTQEEQIQIETSMVIEVFFL